MQESKDVEIMVTLRATTPERGATATLQPADEQEIPVAAPAVPGIPRPFPRTSFPSLHDLESFFLHRFRQENAGGESAEGAQEKNKEVPLLWRPADCDREDKPVHKMGFALDHRARLEGRADLDALFLHRPFFLTETTLPGVPVFASHVGFDQFLSIGYNTVLAEALGMTDLLPLSPNASDRPTGMVGNLKTPLPWYALRALIAQEYQGTEMIVGTARDPVTERVAVAGAMSAELVTEATEAGARVFITGQYRPSARLALDSSRMMMIAVGHRRAELWGLRRLSLETTRAFPAVETSVIA